MTLRIALLIVGALLVCGVYLWSSSRRRRGNRLTYDPHFARIEPADRAGKPRQFTDASESFAAEPADDVIELSRGEKDELVDLPRITIGRAERHPVKAPGGGQLELSFGPTSDEAQAGSARDFQSSADSLPPELLVIYVRSRHETALGGPDLVKALNAVGMRFGDPGVFHHYGAGELCAEEPVFSAANMQEPGYFDLDRIESAEIKGLALFMQLPTSLDGAVAFELFLNTAQRLAEKLSGELYSAPESKLDSAAIDKMRRTAASYSDGSF